MRVLICGSRSWADYDAIEILVKSFEKSTVVIQGMCRGADLMAKNAALKHELAVEDYPAEWERFGKSAGPIRNAQMLEEGAPDIVYAFHSDISRSKGTKDMVEKARAKGIPVILNGGEVDGWARASVRTISVGKGWPFATVPQQEQDIKCINL